MTFDQTATHTPVDPVDLTAQLVRCASVTPEEGGALVLLQGLLEDAGFHCARTDRNGIPNLYARWGAKGHALSFGFNGHTDVVPLGDVAAWSCDPFGAEIRDGWLMGRGACDMKSGVAAFIAAAIDFVRNTPPKGAVAGEVMYGEVPSGSVVVAGSMPSKNGVNLYCAVIVKRVDAQTRSKTSINELLRD